MKRYISLPITGHPIEEVKLRAANAKALLTAPGVEVITPFDICPEPDKDYAYYMGRDI